MTSLVPNMMNNSYVEATESEPLGLLPYHFEPASDEPDISSESDSDTDSELQADFAAHVRVDSTAWCPCT